MLIFFFNDKVYLIIFFFLSFLLELFLHIRRVDKFYQTLLFLLASHLYHLYQSLQIHSFTHLNIFCRAQLNYIKAQLPL